jgi:hypothetical protein
MTDGTDEICFLNPKNLKNVVLYVQQVFLGCVI